MLLLIADGREASVRNVTAAIRATHGKGLRWSVVRDELALANTFLAESNTNWATPGQHPGNTLPTKNPDSTRVSEKPGNTPATLVRARGSQRNSNRLDMVSISLLGITDSLRSSAPSGENGKSKRHSKSKPPSNPSAQGVQSKQEQWVFDLRVAISAISEKTLRKLTIEDRLVCGRYHAWRFSNCTKSEARNRSAGAKAAVAFAKMADSSLFADLTVRKYVDEAIVFHEKFMGEAPWYDPFAIRAVTGSADRDGLKPASSIPRTIAAGDRK